MATPTASSPIREGKNPEETNENSEPLIPGLPDDVGQRCLLCLPYPYQALARSVSRSWNRVITDPGFFMCKRSLSLSLPYLFVFAFHKSTARIQWQALDLRSGRWFVLPPMPCPRAVCPPGFSCTSAPRQGKLFVLGGMRSDTEISMDTTLIYRTSTNQWSKGAPMLTPRSFFAVGNANGKIIAAGGSGSGVNSSNTGVECYCPDRNAWTPVAKMSLGLARYDSAVVGGRMYVTEGWTWPFIHSPRGGVYDPERDTWQNMSDGMKAGWTGLSVLLDEKLFVISEHGDCPMKVYVADLDTWHYVGGDKFPCEAMERPFAVGGVEGRVYVVSRGLNVAVGSVSEAKKGKFAVEWKVMAAPGAFQGFCPSNCQVLYA